MFVKKFLKALLRWIPSSHILMFHHVTAQPKTRKSGCLLELEAFQTMVSCLEHRVSSLEEVMNKRRGNVALTFDDGLEDIYTIAYPFLTKRKLPFAVFIVTDFLDTPGYISTSQLIEMSENPLVTIGSHGTSHKVLPSLSLEEKKNELVQSRRILEDITGRKIEFFAYSHGQFDAETLALVKENYKLAFSVRALPLNFITYNKQLVPRVNVETFNYNEVLARLKKKGNY